MSAEFLVRVPSEERTEFEKHWETARLAKGLPDEYRLPEHQIVQNFTGPHFAEWLAPVLNQSSVIITAVFAYLASRRNTEIILGDLKIKNISPDKLGQVLEALAKYKPVGSGSASAKPKSKPRKKGTRKTSK